MRGIKFCHTRLGPAPCTEMLTRPLVAAIHNLHSSYTPVQYGLAALRCVESIQDQAGLTLSSISADERPVAHFPHAIPSMLQDCPLLQQSLMFSARTTSSSNIDQMQSRPLTR